MDDWTFETCVRYRLALNIARRIVDGASELRGSGRYHGRATTELAATVAREVGCAADDEAVRAAVEDLAEGRRPRW